MPTNPIARTPAKIAVIGLGYVGLPLAVAFSAEQEMVGFDVKARCIAELAVNRTAGGAIRPGGVVIYESTVYRGAMEEDWVPVVATSRAWSSTAISWPAIARVGQSGRRAPPVVKVTAGSTPQAARFMDALYASVVTAGTHRASFIRAAEAAKVVENTQCDLNIALITPGPRPRPCRRRSQSPTGHSVGRAGRGLWSHCGFGRRAVLG